MHCDATSMLKEKDAKAGIWNIQATAVGVKLCGGKRTPSAALLGPAATY